MGALKKNATIKVEEEIKTQKKIPVKKFRTKSPALNP
jgi:hypothetical protein